jgi:RNA polymerase sigma-70 factor, ECF subfamily
MVDSAEPDEFVLVALAQSGDRDALELLFRRLYRPLHSYVCQILRSTPQTDDVLQDIALIIFRNLHYLRDPRAFRPWVFKLTSRYVFRHLKREARRRRIVEADPELVYSAEAPPARQELLETDLLAAMEHLSPASRAVLLLHYQQHLSLEETAAVLEIPLGTAKSRLAYGVSVLRKLMKQKGTQ